MDAVRLVCFGGHQPFDRNWSKEFADVVRLTIRLVVRPAMEQDQQNYAYGSAAGANSNGMSTKSNVSMVQPPTKDNGQVLLSPVSGQSQSSIRGDRRQVEGKSMSVVTEQPATVPMYKLVQVTPEGEITQQCSGIPRSSTSRELIEDETPRDSKMEVNDDGTVYHLSLIHI